MKAASIVNEAYCVEQWKRLRKQLKPIAHYSDRNYKKLPIQYLYIKKAKAESVSAFAFL